MNRNYLTWGVLALVLSWSLLSGGAMAYAMEQAGVVVTTSGRGNVRYGPSTEARVITTLDNNTEILVYGAAEGRDGWYTVAFPRAGHAWVHESVVQATDDPDWYRVTRDGANVRSDSRINADLVTQLALGELVEFKGRRVGSWLAIHPSGARAYMYRSVLNLGPDIVTALEASSLRNNENERRWQLAKMRYEYYRKIFADDTTRALRLNWQGLGEELQQVIAEHPTVRTRLLAQRLQDNIARVISAANRYQQDHGLRPLADPVFELPQPVVAARPPTPTQPAPTQPQPTQPTPAQPQPTQPQPAQPVQPQPVTTEADEPSPAAAAETVEAIADTSLEAVEAPVSSGQPTLVGWIEQRDDPGVGSSFALIDANGEVAAFIKPAAGVDFNLSDFFWRRIEVRGESREATVTINGVPRALWVVEASSVRLAD